jgi:hypothetical protein
VKTVQKQMKKQVQIEQDWTEEETNYADSITKFLQDVPLPKVQVLEGGVA